MIEITSDHFAQLVESIFQDVGVRLGGHAVERVRSQAGTSVCMRIPWPSQ
jgi:hypothetical protein